MKLSDVINFPYSRARDHFKQAHHSEWKGRIVHQVVGALEYVPILNYLIALVDLAVQTLFRSNQPPAPQQTQPFTPEQLQKPVVREFLKSRSIKLPQTPLLKEILEIEETIEGWVELKASDDPYWVSRIRHFGAQIQKLERQVGEAPLEQIKDNYRNNTAEMFKQFYALLMELKGKEENRILSPLQDGFAALTFPQISTFNELMVSMGFRDNKVEIEGYEWSFATVKKYGLCNFQDFKSIGFFDFEEEYKAALCFEEVREHIPEAEAVYESFLRAFEQKVSEWVHRVRAPVSTGQFKSAEEISQFIQATRPLLLKSYLAQNKIKQFWDRFSSESPSLATYLASVRDKPSPFGLDVVFDRH